MHFLTKLSARVLHHDYAETAVCGFTSCLRHTNGGCQAADGERIYAQVVEDLIQLRGAERTAGGFVEHQLARARSYRVFHLPARIVHSWINAVAQQLETELVKVLQPTGQVLSILHVGAKNTEDDWQSVRAKTLLQFLNLWQDGLGSNRNAKSSHCYA